MRSMTGFGRGEAVIRDPNSDDDRNGPNDPNDPGLTHGTLVVELKAVNHRFLDAHLRLPQALQSRSSTIEAKLKKRLLRGRIELGARVVHGATGDAPRLDHARARVAIDDLRALRDAVAPGEPVPLSLLSVVPDLFNSDVVIPADALGAALDAALDEAMLRLDKMRAREGAAIAEDFACHLDAVCALLDAIDERRPAVVEAQQERLQKRLDKLASQHGVDLTADPGRVIQELAVFAERTDVAEEVQRLREHVSAFRAMLELDGAIGRKLDFLLQEFGREANTLGSKSPDVTLRHLVVELKANLERMREQVANVL